MGQNSSAKYISLYELVKYNTAFHDYFYQNTEICQKLMPLHIKMDNVIPNIWGFDAQTIWHAILEFHNS